jgi:hypothetical protein
LAARRPAPANLAVHPATSACQLSQNSINKRPRRQCGASPRRRPNCGPGRGKRRTTAKYPDLTSMVMFGGVGMAQIGSRLRGHLRPPRPLAGPRASHCAVAGTVPPGANADSGRSRPKRWTRVGSTSKSHLALILNTNSCCYQCATSDEIRDAQWPAENPVDSIGHTAATPRCSASRRPFTRSPRQKEGAAHPHHHQRAPPARVLVFTRTSLRCQLSIREVAFEACLCCMLATVRPAPRHCGFKDAPFAQLVRPTLRPAVADIDELPSR